jgi:hypothetical protein
MNKEIFPSASRDVATHNSAAITATGYTGCRVFIDITVHNGGTVTPKVQTLDQVSGQWVDIPGAAFAALSGSNQTKQLTIRPGVAETVNESVSDVLGNTIRVVAPVSVAAVTFSMGVDLIR